MPTHEKLESDPVTLDNIFSSDNELRCPLFQRRFVWNKNNIEPLWRDIDTLLDGEYDVRFLGALVFDNESSTTARRPGLYWIIDGQQRLTTFYLLLLSLASICKEAGFGELEEDLVKQYLLSRKRENENQPKLWPTLEDTKQFNGIMRSVLGDVVSLNEAHQFGPAEGNLKAGFDLIYGATRKRCVSPDGDLEKDQIQAVFDTVLEQIELVEIRLGRNHDPNEVFDRLNKEGERLGIIDLVRNEVLKRLKDEPDQAENIYATHWRPFEDAFEYANHRDQYFFPFALSHDPKITKSRTFQALSERWEKLVGDTQDPAVQVQLIMRDLGYHQPAYVALKETGKLEGVGEELKETVHRLYRLGVPAVTYPYFLNLLTRTAAGEVDEASAVSCCDVIESFLVRRGYVGLEPTGLHAVFKGLWFDAGSSSSAVAEQIQTSTIQFPGDAQFQEVILNGKLYGRKIARFVIEEYERSHTAGDTMDVLPRFTIDHVLPQEP